MEIIKKTNILIKTRKKILVRQLPVDEEILCEQCGGQMLKAQEVSVLSGIGIREIYRLIETGTIHFIENQMDVTHICTGSISRISQATLSD